MEDEIHEIHLIPETEDPDKHFRNGKCWCEPVKRETSEFHDLEDLDEYHVIWEHKATH